MRKDMRKVICETYREGRGTSYKNVRQRFRFDQADMDALEDADDFDSELPKKVGMRRPYRVIGQTKDFGENLNPLERFIKKQIGKKWDDVWSEICKGLNPNSTVDEHVKFHVKFMINTQVVMIDGHPYDNTRRYYKGDIRDLRKGELYVDPDTGIIKKVKKQLKGKR